MKKYIIVFILFGLIFCNGFAQNSMRFGIKSGVTFSKAITDADIPSDIDEKIKTGFAGGGMMIYKFNNNMAIQAELMYVQKGELLEVSDPPIKLPLVMNGFELPVLLKYMVSENMNIYGGFSINYIIAASVEGADLLEEDLIKNFGYGLSLGGQYVYENLIMDLRFDLGLSNYVEEDLFGEGDSAKLNTLYLTIGYLFK